MSFCRRRVGRRVAPYSPLASTTRKPRYAGAACVAVISDLLAGNDPVGRTRAYVQALANIAYSP